MSLAREVALPDIGIKFPRTALSGASVGSQNHGWIAMRVLPPPSFGNGLSCDVSKSLPRLTQVAMRGGQYADETISRKVKGLPELAPFSVTKPQ